MYKLFMEFFTNYFKTFDYKKMIFRIFTVGYTAFLAGFSKDYVASANVTHALNEGVSLLLQGVFAGFGLDQLMFHVSKSN